MNSSAHKDEVVDWRVLIRCRMEGLSISRMAVFTVYTGSPSRAYESNDDSAASDFSVGEQHISAATSIFLTASRTLLERIGTNVSD